MTLFFEYTVLVQIIDVFHGGLVEQSDSSWQAVAMKGSSVCNGALPFTGGIADNTGGAR